MLDGYIVINYCNKTLLLVCIKLNEITGICVLIHLLENILT